MRVTAAMAAKRIPLLLAALLAFTSAASALRVRHLSLYPHSAHARAARLERQRIRQVANAAQGLRTGAEATASRPREAEALDASGQNRGGAALGAAGSVQSAPYVGGIEWNVSYFRQRIDHFSFSAESETTFFAQKYISWDSQWSGPAAGGPIFVYCGNEGPVEWFLDNAGWITEIAAEFGALVVGPEHRYYGDSMPFGSAEAAYRDTASRAYLTTEQAMADMAILLTDLKRNLSAEHCPVVVFGGSYGGMLASWFRLKYPHVTIGAIASSAPILQYEDVVPVDIFYRIVSSDYARESSSCFERIRAAWGAIQELGASPGGLEKLRDTFGLCRAPKSSDEVRFWIEDALVNLAMVDYPIPADFLMPLPAYPIREVCRRIDSLSEGSGLLDRIVAGITVYFNFTGTESCYDTGADPHGESGWGFQACTEQCMPMSSNPKNSMFEPFEWNQTEFDLGCRAEFGVTPRPSWILTHLGGRSIKQELRDFGSNIVFSNGELDPWSGGGVLENISDTIISLIIPDGAHHLDLRASTPADPPSVLWQREEEKKHIRRWLKEYWSPKATHKEGAQKCVHSTSTGNATGVILAAAMAGMLSAVFSVASFSALVRSYQAFRRSFPEASV